MTRKPEAKAYHHLYNSKAWQHLRLAQLRTHYLCRFCEAMGRITPAKVADHVVPHRGDHTMFFEGELQSLCQTCHDSAKQAEERRGYSGACDLDGYPIDPRHPQAGR